VRVRARSRSLVDAPDRSPDPVMRRRALDQEHAELERGSTSGSSGHPVIVALMNAGRRHELPLVELSAYVDSMRLDCGRVRWPRAEVDHMRGSAGAVGLIMAPLIGAPARAARQGG